MDGLTWDFNLVVPPEWYTYDPDPTTRAASTGAAVDQRIRGTPELSSARQALVDVLLGFWDDADDQGALAAAVLWEPGSPAAVAASLTVVAYSGAPVTLEELQAGAARAADHDLQPRAVTRVDLPAGPAVRVRALRRSGTNNPRDPDLVIDVVEHWIAVPGHGDVLVLRGSTPCLDLAEELVEVFDQIAGTLAFRSVPAPNGIDQ